MITEEELRLMEEYVDSLPKDRSGTEDPVRAAKIAASLWPLIGGHQVLIAEVRRITRALSKCEERELVLAAKLDESEAEVRRLRADLKLIANGGCRRTSDYEDNQPCRYWLYGAGEPDPKENWCAGCIADDALNEEGQ